MRLVRLLLYALAALTGLYLLAVILYAIPMISGLLDDTMEVKFDRPDPSIVADYGNGRDDVISGFGLSNGDVFDFRTLLAEAHISLDGDLSKLGAYLQVTNTGGNTALNFDPTGSGGSGGASTVGPAAGRW